MAEVVEADALEPELIAQAPEAAGCARVRSPWLLPFRVTSKHICLRRLLGVAFQLWRGRQEQPALGSRSSASDHGACISPAVATVPGPRYSLGDETYP